MPQSETASQRRHDDEISLVDLASTFLKRRRIFYVVLLACFLVGLTYVLVVPSKYEFVSLVKLAEKEQGEYIQKPSSVIAEFETHWVPELMATFLAENDRKLPFDVAFSNPEGTGLLRLTSEATATDSQAVSKAHSKLISEMKKDQAAGLNLEREMLTNQIDSLDTTIEMLKGTKDAGPSLAAAVEQRVSLQAQLNSTRPMNVLVESRQSSEPVGPAKSLIVVLACIFGLMAGIFSTFFAEFVVLVKEKMVED